MMKGQNARYDQREHEPYYYSQRKPHSSDMDVEAAEPMLTSAPSKHYWLRDQYLELAMDGKPSAWQRERGARKCRSGGKWTHFPTSSQNHPHHLHQPLLRTMWMSTQVNICNNCFLRPILSLARMKWKSKHKGEDEFFELFFFFFFSCT